MIQRELIVFDFDETLVDCNSDTHIHQLAPDGQLPVAYQYKPGQDYFEHAQSVYSYLHKTGCRESDYVECLEQMPEVSGMFDKLVRSLGEQRKKYEMIILSDANSFFINSYLKAKRVDHLFAAVLTNPARFGPGGLLQILEYHIQDYCTLSTRNLCKGRALADYVQKQLRENDTSYERINYVGDGENDLCPLINLTSRDRIFPRAGYPLERLCAAGLGVEVRGEFVYAQSMPALKAPIIPWSCGEQILSAIC